jgi:hypothetical protein
MTPFAEDPGYCVQFYPNAKDDLIGIIPLRSEAGSARPAPHRT